MLVTEIGRRVDRDRPRCRFGNCNHVEKFVFFDWQLADDVENIVRDTEASEHDEKDLATIFCKCKSGAPYTGVVQGNTSDLESEIDDMVARAKSEQ